MELNEAIDLMAMLLQQPESLFYAKFHNTVALSNEARLLQAVQNAVISSIPTKKGEEWKKKDAMVKLPMPKQHNFEDPANSEEAARRLERAGLGRLNEINKKITPKNTKP